MDNLSIARVLTEIGDLLEIKGENPFKIRAYRNAAETIAHETRLVNALSDAERRALPGIGRDIAAKIAELIATGRIAYHQELATQFPPTILDLLNLQGVGPKTVALLYRALNVRTLGELEEAAAAGRLRDVPGMGARKESLILKALAEQRRHTGRRLASEADAVAATVLSTLADQAPGATISLVGSLRRGCETAGDIDILAAGISPEIGAAFASSPLVERVLVHGDTKSSVLLSAGFQADLRIVAPESAGAALQYFTGSKAHNIALRDRALARGLKLNEYGLFRVDDDRRLAGADEHEIYQALGLAYIAPELREDRGEIEAAETGHLPRLIEQSDLRGDLHSHTDLTDGRADLETMVRAAWAAGLQYLAITDHSKSLAMANGLDEHRVLEQARHIRDLDAHLDGMTVLAGIECDIRPDGSMDLATDCLAQLDIVVASIHSAHNQDFAQMTERLLRAIECPWVDVIGHPTGRLILRREPVAADWGRVIDAASAAGVALEINGQPDRRDLSEDLVRQAHRAGVAIVVSSDAHSPAAFGQLRWGTLVARRAWLTPDAVLNTSTVEQVRARLRRARRAM